MNSPYGVYVHIPFCARKCQYCDFVSGTNLAEFEKPYVDMLCHEIEESAPYTVDTIYMGGGTPSLLSQDSVEKLMTTLQNHFSVEKDCEITMEVNPASVTFSKLKFYRKLGINRLSIGVQSMQENELRYLGRLHSPKQAEQTVLWAQKAGFTNSSVDLMYGYACQTMESLQKTLSVMTEWPICHISCYGLRVEPDTPFDRRQRAGEIITRPDDDYADMYETIVSFLKERGFMRYEISNFAKKGYSSRHNLKYWHHVPYVGLGLAAHSYLPHMRYSNTNCLSEYLEDYKAHRTVNSLNELEERSEYIITALRLSDGISLEDYQKEFSSDFTKDYKDVVQKYAKMGLLIQKNGHCYLADHAFYISNAILCDFI